MTSPVFSTFSPTLRVRRFRLLALCIALVTGFVLSGLSARAVEGAAPGAETISAAEAGAHAEAEHHGLTPNAPPIFWGIGGNPAANKVGPFAMTNSMIFTWLVALGI